MVWVHGKVERRMAPSTGTKPRHSAQGTPRTRRVLTTRARSTRLTRKSTHCTRMRMASCGVTMQPLRNGISPMSLRLSLEEYRLLVKQVLGRDGWRCRSCGSRNSLHVHHIIFRSQQGTDETSNLITLCSSCHDGVHKDVKDGQYGLTIEVLQPGVVRMQRRPGWRPR